MDISTTQVPENQNVIRKHLGDWLRDAYAMTQQAIEMYEKEDDRIQHYPALKEKIERQLEVSKRQSEKLKQALSLLGEDTSAFKTGLGKFIGNAQALSGIFMTDEIVKLSVTLYIFAHYEIGNYRVLVEAANDAGAPEIARICEENMHEEEELAEWMTSYLPEVTRQYLQNDAAGLKAGR